MDFLNKAKQTVLNAVGISEQVPEDPQLEALKEKITQLDNIIGVLKKNFHKYSTALTQLTQTATLVGNDVQQFYTRSKTRQASIQKFVEVQSKVDQVATDVFRDQFHRDILATFDKWQRQVQGLWGNMKLAEELHASLYKQDAKLKALKDNPQGGKGSRQKGGAPSDGPSLADLENEFAFTKARLDTLKTKLETEVNQAVENRFTVFDNILVRLMECQVDFFAGSSTALVELKPNVDNYRKRFPKGSIPESLTGDGDSAETSAEVKSEEKPPEKPKQPAAVKKPVARKESAVSEEDEEEEEEEEEDEEESPAPVKQATVKSNAAPKPAAAGVDLLGDLMGAGPAPAAKSAPPSQGKAAAAPASSEGSLFEAFGSAPAAGSSKATPQTKPKAAPAASPDDFLEGLMGSAAPAPAAAAEAKKATKAPKKTDSAKPKAKPAEAAAPAPAPAAASKAPATKPKAVAPVPAAAPEKRGWTDSDGHEIEKDEGPAEDDEEKKVTVKVVVSEERKEEIAQAAQAAVESFQAAKDAEEQMNQEKRRLRLALEEKLNNWEFKSGIRKNIRTLLTTVHTVMWEGSGVDPIPLQAVMNDPGLKKAHRQVVMKCHPDRAKGNAEQEVIAERVFNALNTQYELHKNGQTQ
jgi:hypothetical protein